MLKISIVLNSEQSQEQVNKKGRFVQSGDNYSYDAMACPTLDSFIKHTQNEGRLPFIGWFYLLSWGCFKENLDVGALYSNRLVRFKERYFREQWRTTVFSV